MDKPIVWEIPPGTVIDDGLVIIDDFPISDLPFSWPATTLITEHNRRTGQTRTIAYDGTARSRRRLIKACAQFDRDALAIRWPAGSRVKRAYHQRRR